MNNDFCVYVHTFPNKKRYVGITCCAPNRRWQNGYGYATQSCMHNAILKYGWENITHEIVADHLTVEEADQKEKELIAKFNTTDRRYGYNVELGGHANGHLTEEHKEKIGRANRGKNNGMYGHRYTREERIQLSVNSVWRGRKHTKESRLKMSIAMQGNTNTKPGKDHPMARGINQYDLNGVFIAHYDTAKEASENVGTYRSGICLCAKGRQKTAGGYLWRYADGD